MLGLLKKYLRITSTKIEKVTNRRTKPDNVAHITFSFLILSYTEERLLVLIISPAC